MPRFRPALSAVLSAALAAVLGSALLTSCSSDPSPSAVTIGWADQTHHAVRVSWQDSNAPNRISIEGVVSASPSYVKYVAAQEPNTWAIPTSAFPPDGTYRIAVASGTPADGAKSKAAVSPVFDTDGPARPLDARAQPRGKDVVVTWRASSPTPDFTPGDPLDVAAARQVYVPVVGKAGQSLRVAGPGTTATRQVLKNVRPPYLVQLRATNEWSTLAGAEISARTSATSAAIPSLATFGRPIVIRGRTVQQQISCAESRCTAERTTSAGLPLVVLAQDSAGGPWVTVGRGPTRAGGHFLVRATAPATRRYRIYAPVVSRSGSLSAASSSASGLTRSRVQVAAAGYVRGNVKRRNEVVTAVAVVRPVVSGRATVQFWTGKVWASVKSVPITRGRTTVSFGASKPGVFAYRFLFPGTAYRGRPVFGNACPSLVLRVR
jgi:hypothetical protein